MRINNLTDVKSELSNIYDGLENGKLDLKSADTRTNVLGKYIKAEALEFAKEVFMANKVVPAATFPSAGQLLAGGNAKQKHAPQ